MWHHPQYQLRGTINCIMQNCFKHYKIYIHILNYIWDLARSKKIKFTVVQQYILSVLDRQCHTYRCSGYFRSQVINRHGIVPQSRNIPSLASEESIYSISQEICTWFCCALLCCGYAIVHNEFTWSIYQGCFAGTGAIVRLPQCQWSKPDGYGKISQCITTTKHSKTKTLCIFLGIYCTIAKW